MGKVSVVHNLIGGQTKAKFPNTMGSALSVNMYSESNAGITYQKSIPGVKFKKRLNNSSGAACHGSFVASTGLDSNENMPDAFFVINDVLYRVDYGWNSFALGYVSAGSYPTFAETGGERPFLLIADGANLWCYDLKNGGELESITLPKRITDDTTFIKPSHVQVVSGSIIVNDVGTGYAYYSIPYPLSQDTREVYEIIDGKVQYLPDNVTPKTIPVQSKEYVFLDDYGAPQYKNGESNSDSISALYAIGSDLVVFGPKSIEFWQRGSNEYETWTRTSYTFNREIGLDAPTSVSSVNNAILFVSNGMNAGRAVFAITGTEFAKISETWLDEILDKSATDNIVGFSYSRSNHAFYCIYIPSISRTFCYDLSTKEWSERSSRDPKTGKDMAWNLVYPVWFDNLTVFGHIKDGSIVYLDDDFHEEEVNSTSKVALIRKRQTPVIMNNYQPFIFDELGVEMNTGTIADYSINPKIQLEISEDGGYSFTNTILEECGKVGQYFYRVKFLGLGEQRLCVVRLTFSEPMDLTFTNASVRTTPLTYPM